MSKVTLRTVLWLVALGLLSAGSGVLGWAANRADGMPAGSIVYEDGGSYYVTSRYLPHPYVEGTPKAISREAHRRFWTWRIARWAAVACCVGSAVALGLLIFRWDCRRKGLLGGAVADPKARACRKWLIYGSVGGIVSLAAALLVGFAGTYGLGFPGGLVPVFENGQSYYTHRGGGALEDRPRWYLPRSIYYRHKVCNVAGLALGLCAAATGGPVIVWGIVCCFRRGRPRDAEEEDDESPGS